jgi:hypothetical protein
MASATRHSESVVSLAAKGPRGFIFATDESARGECESLERPIALWAESRRAHAIEHEVVVTCVRHLLRCTRWDDNDVARADFFCLQRTNAGNPSTFDHEISLIDVQRVKLGRRSGRDSCPSDRYVRIVARVPALEYGAALFCN